MITSDNLFQTDKPAIIDFWAPWCVPCRTSKPLLEKLAEEFSDQVNFQTINVDEYKELVKEFRILGIPTLLVINNGRVAKRITGAQTPSYYRSLFETLASGEIDTLAGPSVLDRVLRLGAGTALAVIALQYSVSWLLPVGLIVMFTGIYDRCPIWQAITSRFQKKQ